MTWTPEQIITLAGIIFGFISTALITIGGWFVVSKLNKANTEKAKGEAIAIYQKMLNESAKREQEMTERIDVLQHDLEKMQELLATKTEENSRLRRELSEFKVQIDEQANEIVTLREELQALRLKKK